MAHAETFFAICPRALEEPLADELRRLGATDVQPDAGGVSFAGDLGIGYSANLHSRLASRVLWQVAQGPYRNEDDVHALALATPWEDHFGAQQTLRVDVNASRSPSVAAHGAARRSSRGEAGAAGAAERRPRSLEFVTLRIKDGIVDRLRERTGDRPSIDRAAPDVRVFGFLDDETATLYLDLSGEALFKRGWRADKGEAPLKENLAAGLLVLSGWTPDRPLLDPFCGSGTIVIEATCIAAGRAPGLQRRFAFERLRSFQKNPWRELHGAATARVNDRAPAQIVGHDISTRVVDTARANASLAGLDAWLADGRLRLSALDAREAEPPAPNGLIVTNPPYGEQSNPRSAKVPAMMGDIGDRLKQRFTGWDAWMLTSDRQLPRQMRLSEKRKIVLFNGPLECRFFRFELVSGQYRPRAQPGGS